jgi:hypothetical protein
MAMVNAASIDKEYAKLRQLRQRSEQLADELRQVLRWSPAEADVLRLRLSPDGSNLDLMTLFEELEACVSAERAQTAALLAAARALAIDPDGSTALAEQLAHAAISRAEGAGTTYGRESA